jgi:uncharacterized protein (TIGR00369 family)
VPRRSTSRCRRGVNYPRGPIAWGDAIGAGVIRDVLANLAAHYGEDRYRISPLIARRCGDGRQARWVTTIPRLRRPRLATWPSVSRRPMYARDTASKALGMTIVQVTAGHAELTMPFAADMLNGHAICHGGSSSRCRQRLRVRVQQLQLQHRCLGLRHQTSSRRRAKATCSQRGLASAHSPGRTGVYDVEVANQRGETVALFRGKSYRIKGHLIEDAEGRVYGGPSETVRIGRPRRG